MVKEYKTYYFDSLNELIKYIQNNSINPSESRWNEYAISNSYLSAKTMGYLYGKGFNKLCKNIRKKLNTEKMKENII